jgi:hypothetical protein
MWYYGSIRQGLDVVFGTRGLGVVRKSKMACEGWDGV